MEQMAQRMTTVETRVTVIETELKHLATKAWVLGGVVGGMLLSRFPGPSDCPSLSSTLVPKKN